MSNIEEIEILLIEDNIYDAELAIDALKKNKLANRIEHLIDGEVALDYIFGRNNFEVRTKKQMPKVILLDIKLPKVNGLEVLKKLKSNDLTKCIPVIMLTSSNQEPDIEEAYGLGANSYIVKPVEFNKFIESIKNIGFYWMLINHSPA